MANLRVDKITSTETFETTGSVQFVDADSLQIAANSDFDFGTGDFTVEWWQYIKDEPDEYQTVLSINYATNPNLAIQSASNAGVVAQKVYVNGSSVTFTEESNAPLSTWVHYALVRNGSGLNNLKIYRDGVQTGQGTYTGDIGSSSSINYIGGHPNVASGVDVQGFISNLRIVKGTALYTSNFKPSMRELEVVPGTVLLACQSKTDASLEKTGKTITVNGTAVASELTPGILTPVVKSGGGSAITGSVEFGGTFDHMTITENNDFDFGADDFTMEYWYNEGNDARTERRVLYCYDSNQAFMIGHTNDNGGQLFFSAHDSGNNFLSGGIVRTASNSNPTGKRNYWRHVAACREGATFRIFIDGVLQNTANFGTTAIRGDQNTLYIGKDPQNNPTLRHFRGFISNLRIVKGTALYTDDFIPPTRELKRVPGTVLLCCQDPDDPTQEVTGKTISLNGIYTYDTVVNSGITTAPTPSNFTPQVGDDRKVTFEGVTKINSDAYFYLPTGDTVTRESRSGRGLFGGGKDPSGRTNCIDYINISSEGNGLDFGDLILARDQLASCSSSTRGLWAGGDPGTNVINFVTIATRSNAVDFGDLVVAEQSFGGAANHTRGLFFGGGVKTIQYVTIASTGDAIDFGDLVRSESDQKGCGSPTRCIVIIKDSSIEFVTFASTGNAIDFGDTTGDNSGTAACSDSTRAIRGGGTGPQNAIEYITIASTGNAVDFGDLTLARNALHAVSNSVRGVFGGGDTPSPFTNTIDYVTIQTTGNAQDFGDTTVPREDGAACSDSHGGLG